MIENDPQLEQAREALASLETALRALRDRVAPTNPALFEAMAQDYVVGISSLRGEIDLYTGAAEAAREIAPLWLVLTGEQLQGRDVSSRLLADWLDRIRKAVQNVAAHIATGGVRTPGRPEQALVDATDLRVIAVQRGSIRIGLRMPAEYLQGDMFDESRAERTPTTLKAMDLVLRMALWASHERDTIEVPAREFANLDEAALVAHHVAELAPAAVGPVQQVAFEGALVPADAPIRLTRDAHNRLKGLEKILTHSAEETVRGVIREIDLDRRRIILRERGAGEIDLKCYVPAGLMALAERMLDHQVDIHGVIESSAPYVIHVISIEEVKGT